MKSLIEINTLPRERFMGWQTRLDQVQAADGATAKELARHHFSRALDQKISGIRDALEKQTRFAKMSKPDLKVIGTWQVRNAVGNVFGSWCVMDRLEPGIAAIHKIAGGELPSGLREIRQHIWQTLKKADEVRERFYAVNSSAERLTINLAVEVESLCDELKNDIVAFYTIAQSRYDLPELDGGRMQ